MPEKTDQTTPHSDPRKGYRISNGPVVRFARSDPKLPNDLPEVIELPRVYGAPLLFAIARDPRTVFAYWIIDWSSIFENTAPVDRQVHLRVYRNDGAEETSEAVEPMAILMGGGVDHFDKGMELQGQLWRRIVHEYLQRCDSAGLDRRPRCILPTDFNKLFEAEA